MSWKLLILIQLLFLCNQSWAQEESYYQLPKERKFTSGQITLPNLKTENIFWYVSANAGIKFQKASFSNDFNGRLVSKKINNLYWEAYFGVNKDDKWQIELGYIHDPLAIDWRLLDKDFHEVPVAFKFEKMEHVISARFKKRIFTLDKVTKKSRLNLVAGLQYAPWRTDKTISEFNLKIPPYYRPGSYQDTTLINGSILQKAAPISIELGVELVTRVFEQIEISVFGKYLMSPKGIIYADINVNDLNGILQNSQFQLNGSKGMLGFSMRWNFVSGIRYIPEIKKN